MSSVRDRDAHGRPSNARPRDALGRPLEYGADGVPALPSPLPNHAEGTLELARQLLRQGRPFQAHEVFEERWKTGPLEERALWQGLAQICVALTHRARGNNTGATTLAARASASLRGYVGDTYGLALEPLKAWLDKDAVGPCPLIE